MQVPSAWNSRKRQRTSRSRGETSRKKSRWVQEQAEPTSLEEMCSGICQSILDSKSQDQPEEVANLDTILSSVPYQKILENLFGGAAAIQCQVPVVTKAYEESFMRECVYQGERKCVMGPECECRFIDREHPFTGVELRLPGLIARGVQSTHAPSNQLLEIPLLNFLFCLVGRACEHAFACSARRALPNQVHCLRHHRCACCAAANTHKRCTTTCYTGHPRCTRG